MLAAASPLLVALAAGFLFGLLALFERPDQAIAALNRLCLYLAFPALIFANVYTAELAVDQVAGFVAATIVPGESGTLTLRGEWQQIYALGLAPTANRCLTLPIAYHCLVLDDPILDRRNVVMVLVKNAASLLQIQLVVGIRAPRN